MKNYLNRFICCVALLTGVVSLPFTGYAQQDEPKRVSVVVVAKEISSTRDFVQIPATNLPIVVGRINKSKTYRARPVVSAAAKKPAISRPTVKEPPLANRPSNNVVVSKKNIPARPIVKEAIVAKAKPVATTKPPVKLAPAKVEVVKNSTSVAVVSKKSTPVVVNKVIKEAVVAKAKPAPLVVTAKPVVKPAPTPKVEAVKKTTTPAIVKTTPPVVASKKVEEVVVTKKDVVVLPPAKSAVTPPAEVAKNNPSSVKTTNTSATVPQVNVTKEDKKVVDEFSTDVKMANDLEGSQVSHSAKVNALNYMWIGFFLMLAGFVLGLLFGKPAFLVSVAGLVFIVLGFML